MLCGGLFTTEQKELENAYARSHNFSWDNSWQIQNKILSARVKFSVKTKQTKFVFYFVDILKSGIQVIFFNYNRNTVHLKEK